MAIDFYWEHGFLNHEKVNLHDATRRCLNLAQRFDVCAARQRKAQAEQSPLPSLRLTSEDLRMSDDRAEKIRPAVEQVRRDLFETSHPPFTGLEEANQWLKQRAAEEEVHALAQQQRSKALKQRIVDLLWEYQIVTGEQVEVDSPFKDEFLEYMNPEDGWVHPLRVYAGTSLARLSQESKRLADATAFDPASVVGYILVGIPPLLAPILEMSCDSSPEFGILRPRTTLILHSPQVRHAQWRQLHKEIQKVWHLEGKQPLTEDDGYFLALIQRQGGTPTTKGKGQYRVFYEAIRQEFNAWAAQKGAQTLSTWRVTLQKHKRLLKKTSQLPYA